MWCYLIMSFFIISLLFSHVFYPNYFLLTINNQRPLISSNIIDSELPFNKYRVITSHNTYIRGFQLFDASTPNSIRRALHAGARVIEFDIHPSREDPNIPVVSHAAKIFGHLIYFTTPLSLESCIDVVNDFTYKTSDPVIICLQLETDDNPVLQTNVAKIFKSILGSKLLDKKYKLAKQPFFLEPIKNLLNKVILVGGLNSKQLAGLEDVIDCPINPAYFLNKDHIEALKIDNRNKPLISRVYRKGGIFSELSLNFDPQEYWDKHHQFVAINLQRNGTVREKYLEEFKNTSFLPLSNI